MSLSDFEAMLPSGRPTKRAWSPRECVWLMLMAQQRAEKSPAARDLVVRLRRILRECECRSASSGARTGQQ
ncbi:MAG TPA: hypothetical protein VKU60_18190 [Chloroflexota bacterium]|nr:hypothetical protein [Chloroflexota bacterium]